MVKAYAAKLDEDQGFYSEIAQPSGMLGQGSTTTQLATPALQTRLGALIQIRWLAVAGQLLTILSAEYAVGGLPLTPILAAVGASAILNLTISFGGFTRRIDENSAALLLAFDVVQLAVLLGLTGGLGNPFVLFLLAPVTVGAAILTLQKLAMLVCLSVLALSLTGIWSLPIPKLQGGGELYALGTWLAVSLGIVSVAFFTWRMAEETRGTASAYSEARVALAQEERMAELGALAAAVAHEVNTPLATVSLVAREVFDQLPADSPLRTDMGTLIAQANRCRDTLATMTSRKNRDSVVERERITLPSLVEMAAQLHSENSKIPIFFDHQADPQAGGAAPPWMDNKLEILHGLSNFIQNALQFANSRVEIDTSWGQNACQVRIVDDGPGFPQHILERLGEAYVSGRSQDSQAHLGLGVFIAKSLLLRTKADVSFKNAEDGGAQVTITWKRGGKS